MRRAYYKRSRSVGESARGLLGEIETRSSMVQNDCANRILFIYLIKHTHTHSGHASHRKWSTIETNQTELTIGDTACNWQRSTHNGIGFVLWLCVCPWWANSLIIIYE